MIDFEIDDIAILEIPTKGHALDPYIYKIVFDFGYSKQDAIDFRKQLLSALKLQELVKENIKTRSDPIMRIGLIPEIVEQLESLVKKSKKTVKEKGSGGKTK